MLFYETYFEESNIKRKPLIWSSDKIIKKFGTKKLRVWFLAKCKKTARKLRKNVVLLTFFKDSNINWKPLILSKYKIITKFEPKNGKVSF